MNRKSLVCTLAIGTGLAVLASGTALAQQGQEITGVPHVPRGEVAFEDCLGMAIATVAGDVRAVEFKSEEGVPRYEFHIVSSANGTEWNVDCNASTGFVEHIERHIDPSGNEFTSRATIDQSQADATALALAPGQIVHREWIMNQEGHAIYVLDVQTDTGIEIKVEVRADNGDIHGFNPEYWEIGEIGD